MEIGAYVETEHVERVFMWLARWIGYSFDALDWGAVETGLDHTDDDRGLYFTYPLVGTPELEVRIAHDREGGVAMIRVAGEADEVLAARIETMFEVLDEWIVVR